MKNHVWHDGQLLQTNKKWSALKQRQRTWIHEIAGKEHAAYIKKYGKLPIKKQKDIVLDKIHEHIIEHNIWVPYSEFHTHVNKAIDRLNRKNPLFSCLQENQNPKNENRDDR